MTTIQKVLGGIAAVALIFAGGYGTAIYTRPAKIVEKVTIKEVIVQDEAWAQTKIEEYKIAHKEEFTVTKWKKTIVQVPCPNVPPPADGCKPPCATDCNKCPSQVISIDEGSINSGTNTTNTTGTTNTASTGTSTTTTNTDTVSVKETTYAKPQWILSLKGGVDLSTPSALTTQPITNFLILGVEGSKRLAGPLFIGLWANSNLKSTLTTGLSLSLEL